jgi:hypothetical protein
MQNISMAQRSFLKASSAVVLVILEHPVNGPCCPCATAIAMSGYITNDKHI